MAAIHLFKYREKLQLASPLGRLLFCSFLTHFEPGAPDRGGGPRDLADTGTIDCVIPVPLHRRKYRKRGFNQAWLLVRRWPRYLAQAGEVSREAKKPERSLELVPGALIRNRWTDSQTGFNRVERQRNVRSAFALAKGAKVLGKRVLLVDDVYTTGSTAEACAAVLLSGGARSVDLLTLACAPAPILDKQIPK